MKKLTLALVLFFAINLVGYTAMAQEPGDNIATNNITLGMPQVAKISSPTTNINLQLTAQSAGLAVLPSIADSTARVLISCIIAEDAPRAISANISSGTVPSGTYLKLVAKTPNGNFIGTAGAMIGEIDLSSTSQDIISGIGSCYSGIVPGDGYVLRYKFGISSSPALYAAIRAGAATAITVTLTLGAPN